MTKRGITFFLALCMLFSMFSTVVYAVDYSGSAGENVTWNLDSDGTLTISGEGAMDDGQPGWYGNRSLVKSIVIEDGVTRIGTCAFEGCTSLTSIAIPDSVETIGFAAFRYCDDLQSIIIPDSVKSIEGYAFVECLSLESVSLSNSITEIGDLAFYNCWKLKSITIPESVKSIGNSAFAICTSITSVTIPDAVESIGDGAFHSCTALTEIKVSENNKAYSASSGVLFDKEKTSIITYPAGKPDKSYVIPDTVTSIPKDAFARTKYLEVVTGGNSVTNIGISAFSYCGALKSINISDSVVSIEQAAFSNCKALESVIIPDSVSIIGISAFAACESLKSVSISNNISTIERSLFTGCKSLESVIIPDSVETIKDSAFWDCEALESVTIPDSVTSIGMSAFHGCISLKSITIPASVTTLGYESLGFYYGDKPDSKVEDLVITGVKGSAAETYATSNGFTFVELDITKLPENDFYIDEENALMPNIKESTTASDIESALGECGISATVTDKNGNAIADNAVVGTGCVVKVSEDKEYVVIVWGDADGNGKVDTTDYLRVKGTMYGKNSLTGAYFTAADVDGDGGITVTDYLKLKVYLLG